MALPLPLYRTLLGQAYVGDTAQLIKHLPDASVDLLLTSPPFALQRQKEYGNLEQSKYVDWLLSFSDEIWRVLRDSGSFVLDLGGAYQRGRPVRSLYNYRVLVRLCDERGWKLAEEFFWHNPSKLPSPIEWVNKRKIRAKDAVNTIWWLSKTDFPRADVSRVLRPYGDRMKLLLKNQERYYKPRKRPSGHDIGKRFGQDNGGAIPGNLLKLDFPERDEQHNLLEIPNTESNSRYLRHCQLVGTPAHPARFPQRLPEFFIEFLTDTGDTVLDIFAGSNTTGAAAETLGRRWIAFDLERKYLATSAFRFLESEDPKVLRELYHLLASTDRANQDLAARPQQLHLLEGEQVYGIPKELGRPAE